MKNIASHLLTGFGVVVLLSQRAQSVSVDGRVLSADNFNYSNPNDHYKPNEYVQYGHAMSRSSEFTADTTFVINAAYVPAGLAALGILAFLFINLFFCFRCCCTCIKCLPDETEEKYKTKRFRVLMAFYFILFATIAFDQVLIIGNAQIAKSVVTLQGSIDYVANLVDSVINDAAGMLDYGGTMITDVSAIITDVNSCAYAGTLGMSDFLDTANSTAYAFHDQSGQISSKTDGVDKYFKTAHDYVDLYGNEYRFKIIAAIWLLSILAVLLMLITHFCRTKCGLQTVLLWVWFVFFFYIILGALWGVWVTTMGEFCMTPLYTLNKVAPESMRSTTLYYTACQGKSPIHDLINTAVTQVTDLNSTLSNITATAMANDYNNQCPGNTLIADVQALQTTLTGVVVTILDVEDLTGCESVQPLFFDLINKAWCTELYTGIFYLWGSMLFTNFFLFLSVLVASYVWQYYAFWKNPSVKVAAVDDDDVDADVEMLDSAGHGYTKVKPQAQAHVVNGNGPKQVEPEEEFFV